MQLIPQIPTEIGACFGISDHGAVLDYFKDCAKKAELEVKDEYLGKGRKILRGPAPGSLIALGQQGCDPVELEAWSPQKNMVAGC